MRLDAIDANARYFDVYLDGLRLHNCCVHADEERGEAVCYVRTVEGSLAIDKNGTEALTVTRRGQVEIRPRYDAFATFTPEMWNLLNPRDTQI